PRNAGHAAHRVGGEGGRLLVMHAHQPRAALCVQRIDEVRDHAADDFEHLRHTLRVQERGDIVGGLHRAAVRISAIALPMYSTCSRRRRTPLGRLMPCAPIRAAAGPASNLVLQIGYWLMAGNTGRVSMWRSL